MLSYDSNIGALTGTIRNLSGSGSKKIEPRRVAELAEQYADDPAGLQRAVEKLQLAVYLLAGGGMLARFGACQPREFYIDQRCSVKGKRALYNAVAVLDLYATAAGYDTTGFGRDGRPTLKEPSLPLAGWILEG